MPPSPSPALPSVALRHTLPDGSWHIDWMLARSPSPAGPLLTFRLPMTLDDLPLDAAILVEQLNDHRALYLDYEGPLSDERGFVERVAAETIRYRLYGDDEMLVERLHCGSGRRFVRLRREKNNWWRLEFAGTIP